MNTRGRPAVQAAHELDCISHSSAQTERLGQRLGELLVPGDLILLLGTLGAGKTQFVRGVAKGLESPDLVTSPTFVLINEYQAGSRFQNMPIYHADLYRIADTTELESVGIEDVWQGDGVCLIEWAERAGERLPHEHLAVQFQYLSETKRVLRLAPHGERYQQVVTRFKEASFG